MSFALLWKVIDFPLFWEQEMELELRCFAGRLTVDEYTQSGDY